MKSSMLSGTWSTVISSSPRQGVRLTPYRSAARGAQWLLDRPSDTITRESVEAKSTVRSYRVGDAPLVGWSGLLAAQSVCVSRTLRSPAELLNLRMRRDYLLDRSEQLPQSVGLGS